MNKLVLMTLMDKVAKVSLNPMVFNTEEEAQRYFEEVILRQPIPQARPQDYVWKKIGYFDRATGMITVEGIE